MRLRRASADDWFAVAEVLITSRRASIPEIPPPVHSDEEIRAWVKDTLLATCNVWVIESSEQVIAMMALRLGALAFAGRRRR